jgi:hypothetical protein
MKPSMADAVMATYPNAISVWVNDEVVAHDVDGNLVLIDLSTVTAKLETLQSEYESEQQAKEQHRQNAISKLSALGLTADEISALTQ